MADLRRSIGVAATSFSPNKPQSGLESQDRDRNRDDETGVPKAKRRRTAVACTSCRLRKSRVSLFHALQCPTHPELSVVIVQWQASKMLYVREP